MKKSFLKRTVLVPVFTLIISSALTGCGQTGEEGTEDNKSPAYESQDSSHSDMNAAVSSGQEDGMTDDTEAANTESLDDNQDDDVGVPTTELEVCFGDDGEPFILHLYDNDTAAAIARHVGTANWRLPIYHYDDYDNWEVMQYYDIPSRYEIPSGAETVTTEKAGEVYYSEPNRIVLFYGDAEVTGEYTRVGWFDDTEEFREAVENNPALEGWNTKMVLINSMD